MSTIIKCKFCNPVTENFDILKSNLPGEYEYVVCSLNTSNANFKTRLRTNGKSQDHAHKWLEDFQMQSKCTMRVDRTYPHSGTKNVFKIDLRCQHNTRPRSEKVREKDSCKNTDCPAKMGITIKRVVTERKSRSKDPHLPDYPTVIQIDFCHNHAILTPAFLKHRSVLPEVKEKILALYKLGHNPSTALDMHKYDLLLEHGENFEKIFHDRALLPDSQFCYRLYYKIMRKQSLALNSENTDDVPAICAGTPKKAIAPLSNCENSSTLNPPLKEGYQNDIVPLNSSVSSIEKKNRKKRKLENTIIDQNQMPTQLEEILCKFCEHGGFAGMQITDNNTVMALCTPLMYRVHTLIKHSGEIVFMDAYGEIDEPNSCRVFFLATYSSVGAIPLGCLVTTSTSTSCMKAALDLWKQILPRGSFFNKNDGPDVFFTNDNEAERQSLKLAFPKSQLMLCISHILQASWVFLLDRKNVIKKEHRSIFFSKIKMLLYSQTVEELEMNYAYAIGDNLVKSNAIFLDYLKHIYNRRHDWSVVYRRHLIPRANDFSFFWETAMIILKDPILSRARTYNLLQIIDFLSRVDTYYERKLIDLASHRFHSVRLSRFIFIEVPHEAYTITQNSELEYEVHNDTKDTAYQVDVSLGVCECRTGKTGAPCKHQMLVFHNFVFPLYDCVPPNTLVEKNHLLKLATGQDVESELTSAAISKTVVPALDDSGIVMGDLDPCPDGDFFLDESATCENLTSTTRMVPSILNHQTTTLNLPSSTLIQPNHILEQHSNSGINPQDAMLSSHNLLSQLDHNSPQHITTINHELNPSLEQHLPPVNADLSNSTMPPPSPGPAVPELQGQGVLDLIDKICAELKERTSKSPSTFRPALGTFLKNLGRLSSDSTLEYALYSFGKFSKYGTPLFKRKIVDNKLIGLQTTGELKKRRQPLKCTKIVKKEL